MTTNTQQTPQGGQSSTPPPGSDAKKSDSKTSAEDRQKAQQEVQELRKKLQEAEAKVAATGDTRETTGEEDLKMMQERAQAQEVRVIGKVGGPFTITGAGFGTPSAQNPPWPGQVLIAGRVVPITSWRDHSIKGTLPLDLPQKGDVEISLNSPTAGQGGQDRKLKGQWPPSPRAAQQVTVKTPDGKLVQGEFVSGLVQPGRGGVTGGPAPYLPGAQGEQGGGPDMNPPPGSTGTMAGQQVGSGQASPPVAGTGTATEKK